MKEFVFQISPTKPSTISRKIDWALAGIAWLAFFFTLYIEPTPNYLILSFALPYTFLCFIKRENGRYSNSLGETRLQFNKVHVALRNEDAILWHIANERVYGLESSTYGSGKWYSPKTQEILITTNDNDSYQILGTVTEAQFDEIKNYINAINKNKKVKDKKMVAQIRATTFN